jgi:hypothetical protein
VQYAALEREALKLLNEHRYEPDTSDTLLAAFRALDPKNNGWIELEKLEGLLCTKTATNEDPMRPKELEHFLAVARGNIARGGSKGGQQQQQPASSSKFDDEPEPEKVYYEDYVALMAHLA